MSRNWHHDRHKSKKNSVSLSQSMPSLSISSAFLCLTSAFYSRLVLSLSFSSSFMNFSSSSSNSSSDDSSSAFYSWIFSKFPSETFLFYVFSCYSRSMSIFQSCSADSRAESSSKSRIKLFQILMFKSTYWSFVNLLQLCCCISTNHCERTPQNYIGNMSVRLLFRFKNSFTYQSVIVQHDFHFEFLIFVNCTFFIL